MKVTLTHPMVGGYIDAIPSKSHAHRLLICAALSNGETEIRCPQTNDDIEATVRCLNALGADICYDGERYTVGPIRRDKRAGTAVLDCGESGSTLRFLTPVVAALGIEAELHMSGRLPTRPMSPLREELIGHGVILSEAGSNPLMISGELSGGRFTLDGGVSSQFTTGLLLALPLLPEDSVIELTGEIQSRPYIDLTAEAMKDFGVDVKISGSRISISHSDYISPGKVAVEGDWSNAAFMLCMGAVSRDGVTVGGLDLSSPQGDRYVLDILRRFGADCTADGDRITVRRKTLCGIEIDAADIPDLVPVLSCVAAVAEGTTVIKNCGRLRLKESDRLVSVSEMLRRLGADIRIEGDSLVINGREMLEGGVVQSYRDHRIVMSASVASCVCRGSVTIDGAEAVNKSYPDFFRDLEKISG